MRYLLIILVMFLSGCDKDNEMKSKLVAEAPFDEFWLSVRFDYDPSKPNEFTNLQYYNTWAGHPQGVEYCYIKDGDEEIKISYSNDVLTIETHGDLKRTGDRVPVSYTGDPDLWSGLTCNYYVKIQADVSEEKVISGVFNLDNGKFHTEQDIKSIMSFRKIMQQENEIWSFGKIDGANFIANADIRFALDIIE
jgi:hypothetical protein